MVRDAAFVLLLEPRRSVGCCEYDSFVGTSDVGGVRCNARVGLEVHLHLRDSLLLLDDYYSAAASSVRSLHALCDAQSIVCSAAGSHMPYLPDVGD